MTEALLPYVCPGCGRNTRGPEYLTKDSSLTLCFDCRTPRAEHIKLADHPALESIVRLGDRHAVLAFLGRADEDPGDES